MRILFVGDSEAGAVQPYVSSVIRAGETVSVVSVVGSRIQAWAAGQIATAIATNTPDVVVVFLGTNNYYDTSAPNLAPVFAQLPAGRTVWVGPTLVQGKTWPINGWLQAACAARGIPYVNTERLGIPLRDGVHPTPAGAVQWLKAIWPVVESVAANAPVVAQASVTPYVVIAAATALGWYLIERTTARR